jgi:hypothetical protein
LIAYAVAAWVTLRDDDVQSAVLDRERRRRGLVTAPEDPATPEPPPERAAAPRIAALLDGAEIKAGRIREAIERADLPYGDVSDEVDRLLATMRETARRAALLDDELREAPPDSVAARIEALRAQDDPSKAELAEALEHQLTALRRMESQLERFYDRMEGMLVEFDTVRGQLIAVSASTDAGDQRRIAEELRDLRLEVGAVADGMSAAYAEQPLAAEPGDA